MHNLQTLILEVNKSISESMSESINDFHPNSIRVSTHIHIRPDHTSMTKTTLLSTGLRRRRSRRCRRLCCSKTSNRMSLDTNTNCSYQYQNQHRYRYR